MAEIRQLKILALGNPPTVRRLVASASGIGCELVGLTDPGEALSLLAQQEFDVILIDSHLEEADRACRVIRQQVVAPVALLIHDDAASWKKLRAWEVDGFLLEEAGIVETLARLKAISRRARLTTRVK